MSRTIGAGLKSHLQGRVKHPALLLTLTEPDGTVTRLTAHALSLTVGGNVYSADAGFTIGSISTSISETIGSGSLDIGVSATSVMQVADIEAGRWDDCRFSLALCNFRDTSQGLVVLKNGFLGPVSHTDRNVVSFDLVGLLDRGRNLAGEVYSPTCRADLGDHRCRVPLRPDDVAREAAYALGARVRVDQSGYGDRMFVCTTAGTTAETEPTYDYTVDEETTDGTAVFTAEEAWTRQAVIDAVTDQYRFTVTVTEPRAVDGWFALGGVIWITGANAGTLREIATWTQSDGRVTLVFAMERVVEAGDELEIFPGCDKRLATCRDKFANVLNFVGEPYAANDLRHRKGV